MNSPIRVHLAGIILSSIAGVSGCGEGEKPVACGATEICGDQLDNDCDGVADEAPCGREPSIRFTSPADGATVRGTITAEFAITHDGTISTVELFGGAASLGTGIAAPYRISVDTTALADGPLALRAVATDTVGNRGEAAIQVTIANGNADDPRILRPAAGQPHGGQTTVEATAAGTSVRIELFVDSRSLGMSTGASIQAQLDTRELSEGAHTLRATVTDDAGATHEIEQELVVDNVGPSLGFDPIASSVVSGPTTITISATDPSGIREIASDSMTSAGSPLTFVRDFSTVPAGPYEIRGIAFDRAVVDDVASSGNQTESSVVVTVDSSVSGPQIALISPTVSDAYGGLVTVSFTVVSATPLAEVTLTVDGVAQVLTGTGAEYLAVVDTALLFDGPHPFEIAAVDGFANRATVPSIMTVDNTAPFVSFNPPDGANVSGVVSLLIAATDPSGIRTIMSSGAASTTSPLAVSVDTSAIPSGPYVVSAVAADNAIVGDQPVGNQASVSITWTAQNTGGPALAWVTPVDLTAWFGGSVAIEVDAIDQNGVADVEFRVDGAMVSTDATAPFQADLDTLLLTDGPHLVEVIARDGQNNLSAISSSLQIDNTPPSIVFTPPSGSTVSGVVALAVFATDPAGIRSIESGASTTVTSPLSISVDTTSIVTGVFNLQASAEDGAIVDGLAAGNRATASLTWTVQNGSSGPSMAWVAPLNQVAAYGGTVALQASASDVDGVVDVRFSRNGVLISTDSTAPYTASLNTAALADGDYTIDAIARDVGGASTTVSFTLHVDNTPPTVTFSPAAGASVSGSFPVSIAATDAAGIRTIASSGYAAAASPLAFTFNASALPAGPYTIQATASDNAIVNGVPGVGNTTSASAIWTVVVTGPTMAWVLPANRALYYGGTVALEASASDPSGVVDVRFSRDGVLIRTDTTAPYTATLNTVGLADGDYAIEAVGRDAGQSTTTISFTLHVDNTGPTLSFASPPAPGATVGGNVSITVNASDPAMLRQLASNGFTSALSPLRFTLDTTLLPNGSYSIIATGNDRAILSGVIASGNASSSTLQVNIFNAQNVPPTVAFTSPLAGDGIYRTHTLQVTASAPSGIGRVEFFVNGASVGIDTTSPYQAVLSLLGFTGTLTISAEATSTTNVQATVSVQVVVVQPPPFRLATLYPTLGSGGYDVGDLNGDAVQDLVSAGTAVSVLIGNASGGFQAARSIGSAAVEARLADMDEDGDLDVLARTTSALDLYLNSGTAIFQPRVSFPLGTTSASGLGVGDMDGDGDIDVVIGQNNAGADVIVVKQDPNGAFAVDGTYGLTGHISDLQLADMDGDGDLDVVLGRNGTGNTYVTVYLNGGAGTFGAGIDTFTNGLPERVAVGDLNGDGDPDVAALIPTLPARCPATAPPGRAAAHGFQVLTGDPQPAPAVFRFADADGDNDPCDLADLPEYLSPETPNGVTIGDVDSDGDADVVVTAGNLNGIRVWRNFGQLIGEERYVMARGARIPIIRDLNGDSDAEILVSSTTENAIVVAENMGGGTFIAVPGFDERRVPGAIVAVDFNGGPTDLVVGRDKRGTIDLAQVVLMTSDGTRFTEDGQHEQTLATGITNITSVAVGDLNPVGGGFDVAVGTDLTAVAPAPTAYLLLDNLQGTSFPLNIPRPKTAAIGPVSANGAGRALFSTDGTMDGMVIYDGTGSFVSSHFSGTGASGVVIGDLDADGDLDAAVANTTTNNITFHRWSSALAAFDAPVTYNALTAVTSLTIGRVNGDLRNDLIAIGGTATLLLGDATFTFASPTSWSAGATPSRIVSADFNADGFTDVMVLNGGTDRTALLVARPQGGFFAPDFVTTPDTPTDIAVGDFDANGRVDVAVANDLIPALSVIYTVP